MLIDITGTHSPKHPGILPGSSGDYNREIPLILVFCRPNQYDACKLAEARLLLFRQSQATMIWGLVFFRGAFLQ